MKRRTNEECTSSLKTKKPEGTPQPKKLEQPKKCFAFKNSKPKIGGQKKTEKKMFKKPVKKEKEKEKRVRSDLKTLIQIQCFENRGFKKKENLEVKDKCLFNQKNLKEALLKHGLDNLVVFYGGVEGTLFLNSEGEIFVNFNNTIENIFQFAKHVHTKINNGTSINKNIYNKLYFLLNDTSVYQNAETFIKEHFESETSNDNEKSVIKKRSIDQMESKDIKLENNILENSKGDDNSIVGQIKPSPKKIKIDYTTDKLLIDMWFSISKSRLVPISLLLKRFNRFFQDNYSNFQVFGNLTNEWKERLFNEKLINVDNNIHIKDFVNILDNMFLGEYLEDYKKKYIQKQVN